MLKSEREQEILNILRGAGFVSVKQISKALYTSESSVRRALVTLEEMGLIKRSYGGAELLTNSSNVTSFIARIDQNIEAKKEIARKAVELIPEGSVLFLDQSSSTFFLAEELLNKKSLTVVTNNVEILGLLSQTDFKVYSTGGVLSRDNRICLVGADAQRTFEGMYADFAFFSAKSLSSEGVIWDCTREEVLVRESMMKQANKKVFLCDSAKYDTYSPYRQCALTEVDIMSSEEDRAKRYGFCGENVKLL